MRLRIPSLIAVALLVAACGSTQETPPVQATPPAAPVAVGPTPGSIQQFVETVGDRVFFGFDRSDLSPQARNTLDQQAQWLQTYSQVTILVEGHADERGTREYNLALGDRRATAVRNYLVAQGVDPSRIRTISYGKERPAVLGSNESAWAQNRRGVTMITDGAPAS